MKTLVMRTFLMAVVLALLAACESVTLFQPAPISETTVDVEVRVFEQSSRKLTAFGLFRDGAPCRGFQVISADAVRRGSYEMRVEPRTLSLLFISSGDRVGGYFGPGGVSFTQCVSTLTFEPEPGARYVLAYYDERQGCGARLDQRVGDRWIEVSHLLQRRDPRTDAPGANRCKDEYTPAR
jgi:hypothetical protein